MIFHLAYSPNTILNFSLKFAFKSRSIFIETDWPPVYPVYTFLAKCCDSCTGESCRRLVCFSVNSCDRIRKPIQVPLNRLNKYLAQSRRVNWYCTTFKAFVLFLRQGPCVVQPALKLTAIRQQPSQRWDQNCALPPGLKPCFSQTHKVHLHALNMCWSTTYAT